MSMIIISCMNIMDMECVCLLAFLSSSTFFFLRKEKKTHTSTPLLPHESCIRDQENDDDLT